MTAKKPKKTHNPSPSELERSLQGDPQPPASGGIAPGFLSSTEPAFTPKPRNHSAPRPLIPGYNTRTTSRGITVVEMDWWAHPLRDQAWADAMRRSLPSEGHWLREFMRDWSVSSGSTYYPEFAAMARRFILHNEGIVSRARNPILRGWDFGIMHPACIWLQKDATNRVWVLRELLGIGIDLYSFRELVKYLSGQVPIESLMSRPKAMEVIQELEGPWKRGHSRRFKNIPSYARAHPWFEDGPYLDFSGHEALQRTGLVEGENRTAHQVLAAGGINCSSNYTTVKERTTVFRKLFQIREDGFPGILFDPACSQTILGFGGGITLAEPTKDNPNPDKPAKDGWYEHYHESLGYPLTQVIDVADWDTPVATGQWVGRIWVVNPRGNARPYASTR